MRLLHLPRFLLQLRIRDRHTVSRGPREWNRRDPLGHFGARLADRLMAVQVEVHSRRAAGWRSRRGGWEQTTPTNKQRNFLLSLSGQDTQCPSYVLIRVVCRSTDCVLIRPLPRCITMTLPAVVAAVVAADHLLDLLEQRLGVGRVRVRVRVRVTVTVRVRVRFGDGVRVRGRVGLGVG